MRKLAVFVLLVALAAPARAGGEAHRPTAVIWSDHVLVADGKGAVRASSLDLAPDPQLSQALEAGRPLALASDGKTLWSFDGTRAQSWNAATSTWTPGPRPAKRGAWLTFVVVDGAPVVISAKKIERLSDGQVWRVPALAAQDYDVHGLQSLKSVAVANSTIAIGTSYGEWGGHLVMLDTKTNAWNHYYDDLAYVTGIAWTGEAWAVTWSMSHFEASTRVRLHRHDTSVMRSGPTIKRMYLRGIAWDGSLHAMEGDDPVDLVDILPDLTLGTRHRAGHVRYEQERDAVGVGPGIAAMLTIRPGQFLVVPVVGAPILARSN